MPSGEETVWFLTENNNKFREAESILSPFDIILRQLSKPKLEIQDSRPENIARFALLDALKRYKRIIAVEDSGLFVKGLNGFPGPFSSYVLTTIGPEGVLGVLGNSRQRSAYFQSSLAIGSPSLSPRIFTGKVVGTISRSVLGEGGFGYDPIFIPKGASQTFGQTTAAYKNSRSHRARAFIAFAKWFKASTTCRQRSS